MAAQWLYGLDLVADSSLHLLKWQRVVFLSADFSAFPSDFPDFGACFRSARAISQTDLQR
jgi:hypothetical protein